MSSARAWFRTHRTPVLLVAGSMVGVLILCWALVVPFSDLVATHDVGAIKASQRATQLVAARQTARTQLLTLVAGLFAAAAFFYQGRNRRLERRTFELTQQGQVTDRFAKAIEQLGSDKLDVRIGGIYALERVSLDSRTDQPTVMAVLAAFIREHSHDPRHADAAGAVARDDMPRTDIQAALTVICRRDPRQDPDDPWDDYPIDLTGADLAGGYLRNARLVGVLLYGADLTEANLINADLTEAKLDGANLSRANVFSADLVRATLDGANLTGADLEAADLTRAELTQANLSGANLLDAGFDNADLTGAQWPQQAPAPAGWSLDISSGRLTRDDRAHITEPATGKELSKPARPTL